MRLDKTTEMFRTGGIYSAWKGRLLDDLLQWYYPIILYATVIKTSFHLVVLDQTEVDQLVTHQPGEEHEEEMAFFFKFITPLGEKTREILANHFTSKRKQNPNTVFWDLFVAATAKLKSKLCG